MAEMLPSPTPGEPQPSTPPWRGGARRVRSLSLDGVQYISDKVGLIGAVAATTVESLRWIYRAVTRPKVRIGRPAIATQIVRVGVRSMVIVCMVSGSVGFILVLQMTPPLEQFGQKDLVANIVSVAVLRELGPLIAAIVLTGFAGAAIAAELGTMVVGEEIEALEAQALNPIRFLVIPRVIAATIAMLVLAIMSDFISIFAGLVVAALQFDIPPATYVDNLFQQAKAQDFVTGFVKGGVFGLLIGLIACTNGLRVTGGAAGVGKATTDTVVQSVVTIVVADLIFTYLFVLYKVN